MPAKIDLKINELDFNTSINTFTKAEELETQINKFSHNRTLVFQI